MKKIIRIIVAIIIFVATYTFTFYIPGALIAFKYSWLPYVVAFLLSGIATWYYWTKSSEDNANKSIGDMMLKGGFLIGSISFILGFAGPMIFMPESNQGPLLGLFFTGPIGFVLGLVSGGIFGIIKKRKITSA